MKKIALISSREGSVSGFGVFMEQFKNELTQKGYDISLLRPLPTLLETVPQIGYCAGFLQLREELKKYDLIIGNGVGLAGAIDLDAKIINNMHSNSVAGNFALQQAYENISVLERQYLNRVLLRICDLTWKQIPEVLTTNRMIFKVDRIVAKRADRIIAVSPGTARNAVTHFGVAKKKVTSILNGIPDFWFNKRSVDPLIDRKEVNVVYAGRLGDSALILFLKGFDRILAVLGNLKKGRAICLVHVGTTLRMQNFVDLFNEHKIDYKFNVENSELSHYLRSGDIFVLTSRTESFSLSLAEAMASGLVPVVFPVGIAPDIIQSGVNGFLVDSIEEMREKVTDLLKNNELRLRVSFNAQKTAKKYFRMQKMIQAYVKEIDKVLVSSK